MSEITQTPGDSAEEPRGEVVGASIGPYKLLRAIGQGGFGAVFEAEQQHPIQRHVALKVILAGLATRDVMARFAAERQVLAMMDHPHIAQVLDAGSTHAGRPYFVMELVHGDAITAYCDANGCTVRERLAVFTQVCQAVQHAHAKGIIHRDLKPNNVLVSTHDGQPFAKVIDFGIAKAVRGRLDDQSLFTGLNQMIGTPLYMSPEQAAGSPDIDTRTDIYALGVMLYELLTGTTPVDPNSLRAVAHADMVQLIHDADPPRPSSRVRERLSFAAERFRTEPQGLVQQLRGDLDWIVMKALAKERERRYQTAYEFVRDIERHLCGESVLAAPPSKAYRIRKFVRRNAGAVAAGGLVLASLVAAVAVFAWQARVAQERAEELRQVAEFQAEMLADIEAVKAGKLLSDYIDRNFDVGLLGTETAAEKAVQRAEFERHWQRLNPTDAARELIVETIVAPASVAIDKQFATQPIVDAALRQVVANLYVKLGLFAEATPLQERALATRRKELGEEHFETIESINLAGELMHHRGEPARAEAYFREALEKARRVLGAEHKLTLVTINNLGVLLQTEGKLSEAERYWREALDLNRRVHGSSHEMTVMATLNMGVLLFSQGRFKEAEPLMQEGASVAREVLGDEHSFTLSAISNFGALLYAQGRMAEAEPYFREGLELSRKVLGAKHPETLVSLSNYAAVLRSTGRFGEAEPYLREVLEKSREVLGTEHPESLRSLANLGRLLADRQQLPEAERLFREALEAQSRVLGSENPQTNETIQSLGELLLAQKQATAALSLLAGAESGARTAFADSPHKLAGFLAHLGQARTAEHQFAGSEAHLLEAWKLQERSADSTPANKRETLGLLIELYQAWHAAEPTQGHDQQAGRWTRTLQETPLRRG